MQRPCGGVSFASMRDDREVCGAGAPWTREKWLEMKSENQGPGHGVFQGVGCGKKCESYFRAEVLI